LQIEDVNLYPLDRKTLEIALLSIYGKPRRFSTSQALN
jgi:hypothetical protein